MLSKILNIVLVLLLGGLIIQYIYKIPKFSKNNSVPDFTAIDLNQNSFNLYQRSKSTYTLLSFWGSWCAPCRRKNKEIFKLSKMYTASDLQIITLPIEKNDQAMQKAIEVDSLTGLKHLPQLDYFGSEVAKLYGVREIPTTYLLDQKNNVVGVNLSYSEIVQILSAK